MTLSICSLPGPSKLRPKPAAAVAMKPPRPPATPLESASAAASLCTAAVSPTTAVPRAFTEVRAAKRPMQPGTQEQTQRRHPLDETRQDEMRR